MSAITHLVTLLSLYYRGDGGHLRAKIWYAMDICLSTWWHQYGEGMLCMLSVALYNYKKNKVHAVATKKCLSVSLNCAHQNTS